MTFKDIFNSDFLESAKSFSLPDTLIGLAIALIIGLFIFVIYKKTCKGIMYSQNFALSLIGLSLVTTLVIMAVTSNVILSLGMVGALSIVRFRAAIKEPVEIVYLFWAIAVGIVVGAGLIPLALIGSIVIGIVLLVFSTRRTHDNPYMLVTHIKDEKAENGLYKILKEDTDKYVVKAKTVTGDGIELSCEIKIKDASTEFVNKINSINGVSGVSLVSYNGEYMS